MDTDEILERLEAGSQAAERGDYQVALNHYLAVLPHQRANHTLYAGIGNCYLELHQTEEALKHYRVAVNMRPRFFPAIIGYADSLMLLGKIDKARQHLDKSRAYIETGSEEHGIYLGCYASTFKAKGNLVEAEQLYADALKRAPGYAGLWTACGNLMIVMGRMEEAGMCFEKAVSLQANQTTTRNLSSYYLSVGRWVEGWAVHEQRLAAPDRAFGVDTKPWWNGEPIETRRLVVYSEQGHGDFVLFSRYLTALSWKVPNSTLVVAPSQLELARHLNLPIPVTDNMPVAEFDIQTSLMSLPHVLNLPDPAQAPAPLRFTIDPCRTLPDGFNVCLVWYGNPAHQNDENRSVPLRLFASLVRAHPRVNWFTVSPEARAWEDIDRLGLKIRQEVGTWPETVARLAAADLVITVDTSIAHVAGTIGTPVWMLPPALEAWLWRPALGMDTSCFYPSMRIYRHLPAEGFAGAIQRIGHDFDALRQNRLTAT